MKLALVGKPNLYGINRLYDEAIKQKIDAEILDYSTFAVHMSDGNIRIECSGKSLFEYDALLYRFGSDKSYFLEYMNDNGVFVYDCPTGNFPTKAAQYVSLASAGISIPKTTYIGKGINVAEKRAMLSAYGFPVILKANDGSKGNEVFLCNNEDEVIRKMKEIDDKTFVLQEFIGEKQDLRIIVVGDQVLGAMLKKAKEGEFKTNYSQGGSVEKFELSQELIDMARKSAEITHTYFAGVDIMFHNGKPYVLEVNSVPQFEGFEKSTGINVSEYLIKDLIVKYEKRS